MAISAVTRWEIRTTGASTNGGGFAHGLSGKDVSAATDLVVDATNNKKVTSVTHSFVAGDVHKFISVTAGTNWIPGFYEIESVVGGAAILQLSPAAVGTTGGTYDLYSGIDYGYQDSPNSSGSNISTTDAVTNGTTTLTSATANFNANVVGNVIYLSGGSGALAATRVQITGFTNSTTVTIDSTVAASTGVTMNIGGALDSIGTFGLAHVSGNRGFQKSGAYSVTSATANITGGCLTMAVGSSATQATKLFGYGSVRYDGGTQPVNTAGGISTFTLVTVQANGIMLNVTLDGGSLTSSKGVSLGSNTVIYGNKLTHCTNSGISAGGATAYSIFCEVTACSGSTNAANNGNYIGCTCHNNTSTGAIVLSTASTLIMGCISSNNTAAHGFNIGTTTSVVSACVAYGNALSGFSITGGGSTPITVINCIAENNTQTGLLINAGQDLVTFINCAAYNNGAGNLKYSTTTATNLNNVIIYTASAFVNAASNNFELNNTAGGGALLRAQGFPTSFPGLSTTNYLDIGAVQHQTLGGFFSY